MYLDSSDIASIDRIIAVQEDIKAQKEALREEVKKISTKMGVKPDVVQRIVNLVKKSREDSSKLEDERMVVEVAERLVGS